MQKTDLTFTAVVAMGMHSSYGAVLDVNASDSDVRRIVMEDIEGNGDQAFIDVLRLNDPMQPRRGLIRITVELDGWPEYEDAPDYKLTGVETLAVPS